MNEDKIVVINEDGTEIEMDVLFTFDSDETNKQYVLYYDATKEDGEVYVSSYTAEGELLAITDEKEWDMINEVFETFMSSDSEEEHHHHNHEHNHDHEHHHSCSCGHDHSHEEHEH